MKVLAHFSLVAMLPAVFNISAASASPIMVPLCTGDGQVHMVPIPGGDQQEPGSGNACCVKGCHGGSCRKRTLKEFEPSQ